ncbi:helix-turn-helix domain-containing protein [Citrobacter freundii]|uniref:XRE family transcriptional regulator n=1 Tax=Enterobacteriaceae TaxID=543 RepID=UPI00102F1DB8|nr:MULTISPECIES: S24 family peptidase [Enterobacteriaceae]MCD9264099.1 helix-turn-helix domain-containing protein [Citrobacter braakii]MCW1437568.1 helix-turn-helix domain-containing protein [Citrobacter freundii]MCW1449092.1 helix-turn-helix domain-containing protein [Citrobacter freundii]MDX7346564.1 S24 family peptidase [Citrobacter braakii]
MAGKKESVEQFSERLKSIVPSGSGRDFAKKAGIGYSTVHNYLQAVSSPTLENLVLLAKAGDVSVEWLATGKESTKSVRTEQTEQLLEIPFIDREEFLLLNSSIFPNLLDKRANLAALRVKTDVMEPTFTIGSVLLIDQYQKQLRDGKVVALHKEGDYLYKRVQVVPDGYNLSSDNTKYSTMTVNQDSLSSFDVLGEILVVLNHL